MLRLILNVYFIILDSHHEIVAHMSVSFLRRFYIKQQKHDIPQYTVLFSWRRQPDLNRWIKVLQTSALPLGYVADSCLFIISHKNIFCNTKICYFCIILKYKFFGGTGRQKATADESDCLLIHLMILIKINFRESLFPILPPVLSSAILLSDRDTGSAARLLRI